MKVVAIGGGHGLAQILLALKQLSAWWTTVTGEDIEITAITTVTDTGGSTGRLRREYGLLGHIGDLTHCVFFALCRIAKVRIAFMQRFPNSIQGSFSVRDILSRGAVLAFREHHCCEPEREAARFVRSLRSKVPSCVFDYRFRKIDLQGHSVKNLFIAGAELAFREQGHPDPIQASLDVVHAVAHIAPDRVMPVSKQFAELIAYDRAGNTIQGETLIDCRAREEGYHSHLHELKKVSLSPSVDATPEVLRALREADIVFTGLGSPRTSVEAALAANGILEVCSQSLVPFVLVMNLTVTEGESQRFKAQDFVDIVQRRIGRGLAKVICDDGAVALPSGVLARYLKEHKVRMKGLVRHPGDRRYERASYVEYAPLATVEDGRIVHDPKELAKVFGKVFKETAEAKKRELEAVAQ